MDNAQANLSAPAGVSRFPWSKLAWLAALLVILYAPVLSYMANEWVRDEDMGHGVFVPVVAAWIVWQKREELLRLPVKPNYWGLLLVIWGGLQLALGTLGVELFVSRTAFLVSLVGVVLMLCGTAVVRLLLFPLFLLVFMIRIPAIIYNQITFPLQLLASRIAETALALIGVPVLREGNVLELASQRLSVVEACSGIRSLLSLSFLALVYGHFFEKRLWLRALLLAFTVPIAILANSFRVTLTGILSEYKREWSEGFFHSFEGWVIFMVALGMLIAAHRLTNWFCFSVLRARHEPTAKSSE